MEEWTHRAEIKITWRFLMCRNIKQLRRIDRQPSDTELADAALQFVRKVTGYRKPSRANQVVFDQAVAGIAAVTRDLFDELHVKGQVPRVEKRS
jgi:hypothetical protein